MDEKPNLDWMESLHKVLTSAMGNNNSQKVMKILGVNDVTKANLITDFMEINATTKERSPPKMLINYFNSKIKLHKFHSTIYSFLFY